MAMQPFNNALAQISAELSTKHPKLVNKFDKIERIKSSEGTIHELRDRNSYGLVSAVGFKGRVEMAYDRINYAQLMGGPGKQGNVIRTRSKPSSTHKALALLDRKWNLGIPPESILDLPVKYDSEGIGTVTVEAVDGDVIGFNKFTFKLKPGPDNISTLPLKGNLGAALYPSGQTAKGQAQLISYPVDTTAHNAYLASVWSSQPIDAEMIQVINDLTGVTWSLNPGEYSLSGAEVVYGGIVRPGYDMPKANFTRIVTINLGAACSNFAGELVFYHNPN